MKKQFCSKLWTVVTYPESSDALYFADCLDYARCAYAYILHDKDVWCDGDDLPDGVKVGDFKKPHYHWCIEFTTPHTEEYVKKIFGVSMAIPMKRDKKLSYRYLLHLDDKDKYQYRVGDVVSNITDLTSYFCFEFDLVPDERQVSLMDGIQALAGGLMTYREFYSIFPEMLYKACVVATLVKQFGEGGNTFSALAGDFEGAGEIVSLPNGERGVQVRPNIVMAFKQ